MAGKTSDSPKAGKTSESPQPEKIGEDELRKYHVMVSEEAGKKIPDKDEVKMFADYALIAFKKQPETNTFAIGKLGLVLVKNENQLIILTKEEKERILGK